MEFTKPKNLNAGQLRDELKAAGIAFLDKEEVILVDTETTLQIDLAESDKDAAIKVIAKHVGVDKPPSLEDKLASIGLNIDELKAALLA